MPSEGNANKRYNLLGLVCRVEFHIIMSGRLNVNLVISGELDNRQTLRHKQKGLFDFSRVRAGICPGGHADD